MENEKEKEKVPFCAFCGPAITHSDLSATPPHLRHCEDATIPGKSFVTSPQYPSEDLEIEKEIWRRNFPARPLTYLACPYSHPSAEVREWRFQQSVKAAAWLLSERGLNVFSPVTHSHPLVKAGGCAGDWTYWEEVDREYLGVSNRVLVLLLEGWNTSRGVTAEIEIARERGLTVGWLVTNDDGSYHISSNGEGFIPLASPLCYKQEKMRTFTTGATRNLDSDKPDYEGFLSPLALAEFGKYMLSHQVQADGTLRAADNWQKGIPLPSYMKSIFRHLMAVWTLHRGFSVPGDEQGRPVTLKSALSALLFNTQGMLHEIVKAELGVVK